MEDEKLMNVVIIFLKARDFEKKRSRTWKKLGLKHNRTNTDIIKD